jgi:predicted GNAT family N-acyltransferase
MTEIRIGCITAAADMDAAFAIRREVFCGEQGVSEAIEIDGRDGTCRHYLVTLAEEPIGTARCRPLDAGTVKIERVAVLRRHRGTGFGWRLMQHVLADLAAEGTTRAIIHAQSHARAFYESRSRAIRSRKQASRMCA